MFPEYRILETQKLGRFLKYFASSPYLSLDISSVLAVEPYFRGECLKIPKSQLMRNTLSIN